MDIKRTSKFLSLILRHKPETIGISLDSNGWAGVDELLNKMSQQGTLIELSELETVVAENDKQRFEFNEDRTLIRARQGHSISIELGLEPQEPPNFLFHGTAERNINSIKEKGITKGERHHVHLSLDERTAMNVGMRYGKPVVLTVDARKMYENSHLFFLTENGVWLTEHVPTIYITWADEFLR